MGGLAWGLLLALGLGQSGWAAGPGELARIVSVLGPLHRRPGPPKPGDWLAARKETGQTFQQYLRCNPVLPTAARRTIYVQPIGPFTTGQQRVLERVVEGMGKYLGLPVATLPGVPESRIPAKARRQRPEGRQFLTDHILYEVLKPNLPKDAAACIGLTATDLWAGPGWNFVFGEASIQDRVGVWSLARLGEPDRDGESFRLCLWRALGTAVHETLHMFTFLHCTAFECVMAGSNSLPESDRHPLWLCPECLAKLCHAANLDPRVHCETFGAWCRKEGFAREAAFLEKSASALKTKQATRR